MIGARRMEGLSDYLNCDAPLIWLLPLAVVAVGVAGCPRGPNHTTCGPHVRVVPR